MTGVIQSSASIYFEKKPLIAAISKRNKKSLEKAGSYVATLARNSIKRRAGKSAIGQPPVSRTGKLKNSIGFSLTPNGESALAGALIRDDVSRINVASALEHGGTTVDKKTKKSIVIAQRPFMETALIQSKGTLAKFFNNG